jgi:hypothetical protein
MKTRTSVIAALVGSAAIGSAACGSPPQAAAPTTSAQAAAPTSTRTPCTLNSTRTLILWEHWPRLPDNSTEIGDIDGLHCAPTLAHWREGMPTGPGYCTKIAWSDDNPGYPVESVPAPPLKHVLDEVGDC